MRLSETHPHLPHLALSAGCFILSFLPRTRISSWCCWSDGRISLSSLDSVEGITSIGQESEKKGVKKLTLESGEPSHLNFFNFLMFEWVFERIQPILALIWRELSFKYMICFLFNTNAHSGLWAGLSPHGIVAEACPFSWKLSKELKTLRGVGGGEETSPYFGGK